MLFYILFFNNILRARSERLHLVFFCDPVEFSRQKKILGCSERRLDIAIIEWNEKKNKCSAKLNRAAKKCSRMIF